MPGITASDARKLSARTRASRAEVGTSVESRVLSAPGASEGNELRDDGRTANERAAPPPEVEKGLAAAAEKAWADGG